ncbi:MAG: DUF3048 domain-containing protein [Candidatus Nanopelagicales bacterium]
MTHRFTGRKPTGFAVLAVSAAFVLSACGGGDDGSTSPVASVVPTTPSTSATASPSPSDSVTVTTASPFSGLPDGADKPVLVVKLDNTKAAQPHAGLTAADLVYVEEVEWGLTRLAAVFATQIPDVLGPVRSARVSDIDIVEPFGRVAFAYSGAQGKLLPSLAAANFFDASANASYVGWFDDANRNSPVDHMIRPAEVLDQFPDAARASSIGLEFSAQPPRGGAPGTEASATWPSSSISFSWDQAAGDYIVSMDGSVSRAAEGGSQRAATVVIQSVVQSDSGYGDKFGGVTPQIDVIGSGDAVVLRDGQSWPVTWERSGGPEGTTYLLADGSVMPFAIGQAWIVLLDATRSPAVS